MSVPNHSFVVNAVIATGKYELKTHEGQASYVDAAVLALHRHDPKWMHLKKKPAQTNIHGHAEDAALYLLPDGKAQAVDFVIGAGGTNPSVGWGPDPDPLYTHEDALDPDEHDKPAQGPTSILPKAVAYELMVKLNNFYAADPDGLKRPGGMVKDGAVDMEAIGQWFYQMVVEGVSWEEVEKQIRASQEWKDKHP